MHISDEFVLVKVYGGLQNSDLWPNGGAAGDAPFHLLTPFGVLSGRQHMLVSCLFTSNNIATCIVLAMSGLSKLK